MRVGIIIDRLKTIVVTLCMGSFSNNNHKYAALKKFQGVCLVTNMNFLLESRGVNCSFEGYIIITILYNIVFCTQFFPCSL